MYRPNSVLLDSLRRTISFSIKSKRVEYVKINPMTLSPALSLECRANVVKLMIPMSVISFILVIYISCRINNRRFSILRKFEAFRRIVFCIKVVFYKSILTLRDIGKDACTLYNQKKLVIGLNLTSTCFKIKQDLIPMEN